MNYSDYRFTLDVQIHQAQVSVPVTLGDTARRLCISLTDGRKPYVIAEGCIATFNAKKPDGTVVKNSCIIERNTMLYEFTEQTTNVEGVVNCDITIYGVDGKVLYSPQFILVVDKKVVRDGEIPLSVSELAAFDSILVAEAARKIAEIARETNEEQRQDNENQRQTNENQRFASEIQRKRDFDTAQHYRENQFKQSQERMQADFDEAEAIRTLNENNRNNNELTRDNAEILRINQELIRQQKENERISASIRREERFAEMEQEIGNLDAALDELHNYAQALIGGGTV